MISNIKSDNTASDNISCLCMAYDTGEELFNMAEHRVGPVAERNRTALSRDHA